jgi:uncharacterized membrane protein YphA (DoxX/SURF4 family)
MSPQDSSRRLSFGILLVRILVGRIFLSEGIQKFLLPPELGIFTLAATVFTSDFASRSDNSV